MDKKFLKVGKSVSFKFNTDGLECDLMKKKTFLKNRWKIPFYIEESDVPVISHSKNHTPITLSMTQVCFLFSS